MTRDPGDVGSPAAAHVSAHRPRTEDLVLAERLVGTGALGHGRTDKGRSENAPASTPATREQEGLVSGPVPGRSGSRLPLLAGIGVVAFLLAGGGYAFATRDAGPATPAAGATQPRGATASSVLPSGSATRTLATTATPGPTPPSATEPPGATGLRLAIASPCPHVPAGIPAAILGRPLVRTFVLAPGQSYPPELRTPLRSMSHQCRYYAAALQASGRSGGSTTRLSVPRSVVVSVDGSPIRPETFAARVARSTGEVGCSAVTVQPLGGLATSATRCTTAHDLGVTSGFVSVSGLFGTTLLSCAAETAPAGEAADLLPRLVRLCTTVRDSLPRG